MHKAPFRGPRDRAALALLLSGVILFLISASVAAFCMPEDTPMPPAMRYMILTLWGALLGGLVCRIRRV
jgi:hypothetical protein